MNCHDKKISVDSIETTIIKPSSPTPSHLAKFKLSLIDNHMAPSYVPFIFFYPAPRSTESNSGERLISILKSSLAHALARFYPLAGRLSNSDSGEKYEIDSPIPIIHCNDEGVPFTAARVVGGGSMTLFLSGRPESESLQQFLPFSATMISDDVIESVPQIAVRATIFPCGGIAVGLCTLHKVIDGHTATDFVKLWAANAAANGGGDKAMTGCGGGDGYAHGRAATALFPARHDDVGPPYAGFGIQETRKSVMRRFVLDEEAISALKARARTDRVPDPTRSEVAAGLIWKSVVSATARVLMTSTDGGGKRPVTTIRSVAGMAVDLRPRMKKPWPGYSIGNIFWLTPLLYDNNQESHHETKILQHLVGKLRSSIAKLDREFMEKLEGGEGKREFLRNQEMWCKALMPSKSEHQSTSKVLQLGVSSVIGLGLYDVDFGWGKPVWISMAASGNQLNNVTVLVDSPVGYGIEAWITLHEEEMSVLEHDPEFLAYFKNNPSVLGAGLARL